jgi:hypothetical protein
MNDPAQKVTTCPQQPYGRVAEQITLLGPEVHDDDVLKSCAGGTFSRRDCDAEVSVAAFGDDDAGRRSIEVIISTDTVLSETARKTCNPRLRLFIRPT